jgi:hypothetical protein
MESDSTEQEPLPYDRPLVERGCENDPGGARLGPLIGTRSRRISFAADVETSAPPSIFGRAARLEARVAAGRLQWSPYGIVGQFGGCG